MQAATSSAQSIPEEITGNEFSVAEVTLPRHTVLAARFPALTSHHAVAAGVWRCHHQKVE